MDIGSLDFSVLCGETWRFFSSVFVTAVVVPHHEEEPKKGWVCCREGLSFVLSFHGWHWSVFFFCIEKQRRPKAQRDEGVRRVTRERELIELNGLN